MAAYSDKNELFMLTRRIKLSSVLLDFKEAKNKDGSPKQTATDYVRDQLSNIASNQIRNAVLSEFERRIKEGKTPHEAIAQPKRLRQLSISIEKI